VTRTVHVIGQPRADRILVRAFKRPIHPGWIAYAYSAHGDAVGFYGIAHGLSKESAAARMKRRVERDLLAHGAPARRIRDDR
jgi:hypothetical protein